MLVANKILNASSAPTPSSFSSHAPSWNSQWGNNVEQSVSDACSRAAADLRGAMQTVARGATAATPAVAAAERELQQSPSMPASGGSDAAGVAPSGNQPGSSSGSGGGRAGASGGGPPLPTLLPAVPAALLSHLPQPKSKAVRARAAWLGYWLPANVAGGAAHVTCNTDPPAAPSKKVPSIFSLGCTHLYSSPLLSIKPASAVVPTTTPKKHKNTGLPAFVWWRLVGRRRHLWAAADAAAIHTRRQRGRYLRCGQRAV